VAWGIGGSDELRTAGADFIVDEAGDLVRLLLGRR
jgi:phosphoglycolate phosphatase-like HAD superfamily hydrolase